MLTDSGSEEIKLTRKAILVLLDEIFLHVSESSSADIIQSKFNKPELVDSKQYYLYENTDLQ